MSFNTVPFNPYPPSSEQQGSGGGGGSYVLPIAAADTLGGIKVGDNLTVEEDGTLNAADPYTLPIAGADTLGGVKVGSGLSIDSETGALSADSQIVDYSTTEQATGQKWIDGKDVYVKVFSGLSASLVKEQLVNTNEDISDIDEILFGFAKGNDGVTSIMVSFYKIDDYLQLFAYQTGNVISEIILYYTKIESEV